MMAGSALAQPSRSSRAVCSSVNSEFEVSCNPPDTYDISNSDPLIIPSYSSEVGDTDSQISDTFVPCGQKGGKSSGVNTFPLELSLPSLDCTIVNERSEQQYLNSTQCIRDLDESSTQVLLEKARQPIINATLGSMGKGTVILIKPVVDSNDFTKNPFFITKSIKSSPFKSLDIKDVRVNHKRQIIAIEAKSPLSVNQVEILTKVETLGNTAVRCYVPRSDATCCGVIYPVALSVDLDELKNEATVSNNIKIQSITRLKKKINNKWEDSLSIKVLFESKVCPEYINVDFVRYQVKPFVAPPLQCYNCQRIGHTANGCKAPGPRCMICGGAHLRTNCQSSISRCANCKGDHVSNSRKCPYIQDAIDIEKIKVSKNINYVQAREIVMQNHVKTRTLDNSKNSSVNIGTGAIARDDRTSYRDALNKNRDTITYKEVSTQTVIEENVAPNLNQYLNKDFLKKLKTFMLEVFALNFCNENTKSRSLLIDSVMKHSFGVDPLEDNLTQVTQHDTPNQSRSTENIGEARKRTKPTEEVDEEDEGGVISDASLGSDRSIWQTIEKKQIRTNIAEKPGKKRRKRSIGKGAH